MCWNNWRRRLPHARQADPEQSYVASLHAKGLNKILEKIGEEATEVILAAKDAAAGGDQAALDRRGGGFVVSQHGDVVASGPRCR